MKTPGAIIVCVLILCGGCLKPSPYSSTYNIPATYNFYNVNDTAQLVLLAMADQLTARINLANTTGTTVSAQVLTDMFNNRNGYFNDSTLKLNASGVKLANYCAPSAQTDLLNYFDSIGTYSQSATAVTAGYLLSPNGVYYSEVIQKTLISGILTYTIDTYLADSIGDNIDNINIIPGYGTLMEHVWDEAFGLFGVPIDFPADTQHLRYLGYYSNLVDSGLQSNATLMTAFITGRAAITSNDMGTKQAQATQVVTTLEQLEAASLIHELNAADKYVQGGNQAAANAALSAALGFMRGLGYDNSPSRIITGAQLTQLVTLFGTGNLYAGVNTEAIRQALAGIYGFTASQLTTF